MSIDMRKAALWAAATVLVFAAPTFARAACQTNFTGTIGGPAVHITVYGDAACTVPVAPASVTWSSSPFTQNATHPADATGFNFSCTVANTLAWTATYTGAGGATGALNLTCNPAISALTFGP